MIMGVLTSVWGGGMQPLSDPGFGKMGAHPGLHSLTLLLDIILGGKTIASL